MGSLPWLVREAGKPLAHNQNWEGIRNPAGESKTYTYKLPKS